MHDPREPHLTATKRILRYLQGTLDHGLLLRRTSMLDLVVYTDTDWAGCPNTRWSTLGYAVFLDDNLAVYLSTNPVQHQRTKHVEIDLHFVHKRVAVRDVRVLHVPMTSSPRGCPPRCSRSFGPVSMSVVARVSTAEGVRECFLY
jgi:hypothetical protein